MNYSNMSDELDKSTKSVESAKPINPIPNSTLNLDPNPNPNPIPIIQLINNLNGLGLEKEKNSFIQNYGFLKEQIELTDKILEQTNSNQTDLANMEISELFQILESNKDLLYSPDKLDVQTFKLLMDITKILEEQLHNSTLNVIDVK